MESSATNAIEIDRTVNKTNPDMFSENNKNTNREFVESFANDRNQEFKEINKETVRELENQKNFLR